MKKFLIGAVALLGLVAVNVGQAKAEPTAFGIGSAAASAAAGVFVVGVPVGLVYLVARDINQGGLNRKLAEVVPGAGYQARDLSTAARLTHEFNVAMGYADDEQTARFLASASR